MKRRTINGEENYAAGALPGMLHWNRLLNPKCHSVSDLASTKKWFESHQKKQQNNTTASGDGPPAFGDGTAVDANITCLEQNLLISKLAIPLYKTLQDLVNAKEIIIPLQEK